MKTEFILFSIILSGGIAAQGGISVDLAQQAPSIKPLISQSDKTNTDISKSSDVVLKIISKLFFCLNNNSTIHVEIYRGENDYLVEVFRISGKPTSTESIFFLFRNDGELVSVLMDGKDKIRHSDCEKIEYLGLKYHSLGLHLGGTSGFDPVIDPKDMPNGENK